MADVRPRPSECRACGAMPPQQTLREQETLGSVACGAVTRVLSCMQPTGDVHLGNYLGALRSWVERPARGRRLPRHRRPARPDGHRGAGRRRPAHGRAGGDVLRRRARPRRGHGVRAEPRARAQPAGVGDGVQRQLRRAVADDPVQGQVGQARGRLHLRPGCSPTRRCRPPTSCSTTPTRSPSATTSASTSRSPATSPIRFNHRFGETFVVPAAVTPKAGARVMDLQNPLAKMSKSADTGAGLIQLLDDPEMIARKFKRAVTDSESEVRYDPAAKPGVSNLLEILGAATGQAPADLARGYTQYGPLKADAGDAVIELLTPIQARYRELLDDPGELASLLRIGSAKARAVAVGDAAADLRRHRAAAGVAREPHGPAHHRAGHPGARQPRRRAAVRARRHGDRRPPRHGPARRAGHRRHRARPRRRGVQLPHLRHDRAGRPPPRRRPAGRRRRRRRADDVAVDDRRRRPRARSSSWRRRSWRGWLGASGDVFDFGVTYLRITAVGVPFVVFALGAQGVQRGAADYRTPLVILFAVEPRQRRARGASSCSASTGACPARRGRRSSPRSAPASPSPSSSAATSRPARHRRPSRAGMAPLLTRRPLPAAARRLDARRHRPGRRRSPPASTPRRWPPTRSPPACCCSWPSPSTPWPSRPRRWSPRSSGRARRAAAADLSRRCVRLSIITAAGAAAAALAALAPVLPDAFSADAAVTERATAALLWLAADARAGGDRLRLRRRADRRRRLPLPRPRRPRLPRRRRPDRRRGAARPTAASGRSGPAWPCGWCCAPWSTTSAPPASSASPHRAGFVSGRESSRNPDGSRPDAEAAA